ncbi:MAG: hypothetical protein WD470_12285 [Rhodospirillaceae bacterium]
MSNSSRGDFPQYSDRASTGFMTFMNSLGPRERAELVAALREPNTFLAEDMDDVLAILQTLQK